MDVAFQPLKAQICQTLLSATLAYYNRSKPVMVQMDASKYGLGAVLIQSGHPIAFASKTLTEVEICYVNIEREFLSVGFGLKSSIPTSMVGILLYRMTANCWK